MRLKLENFSAHQKENFLRILKLTLLFFLVPFLRELWAFKTSMRFFWDTLYKGSKLSHEALFSHFLPDFVFIFMQASFFLSQLGFRPRGHIGHEAPPMTHSLFYWHHPSNSNTLRIISTVSHQNEQDWTLVSSMRKGQCQRLIQWAMRYFHKNWLLSFQRDVAPGFCYSYLMCSKLLGRGGVQGQGKGCG